LVIELVDFIVLSKPTFKLKSRARWRDITSEETTMKTNGAALAVLPILLGICAWGNLAAAGDSGGATSAMIAARQKFFGAENVDPWRGM
jgi:hypothetical protein